MQTPESLLKFIEAGMPGSLSYAEYRALVSRLHAEGKTTGPNQSESLVAYSKMNEQRMNRLDKTVVLSEEFKNTLTVFDSPQTWVVITEAWCGDAAQNVPVFVKMAEHNPKICLRLILRDENPEIMKHFLTNGGTSIPVLICLNDRNELLASWAPRPQPAQEMLLNWKSSPEPKMTYEEFATELHTWYAHDKTKTLQQEMTDLLRGLK